MRFAVAILVAVLLASSARAEIICGPRDVVLAVFADTYGRAVITSAHRQQTTTVEIVHARSTGTWFVMGLNYLGRMCVTVRQTRRVLPEALLS